MSKKKSPEILGKEYMTQQLEYMRDRLEKTPRKNKPEREYLKGIIAGLETAMFDADIAEEKEKSDGSWYVIFDTNDMSTAEFYQSAKEAKAYLTKLMMEDMATAETVMVIKGRELKLKADFEDIKI
jgi:hypothetical protein